MGPDPPALGSRNVDVRELTHLHVIAIRYRNAMPAEGDERGTNALVSSGAIASAGVPFEVFEPRLAEETGHREAHGTGLLCGMVANDTASAVLAGSAVLVVGGNCSHAPGVVGGLERAYGAGARIGLVWFDAHGDFNTPATSVSGSLGGMPVAVIAGLAHEEWRESSGVTRPLDGGHILLVGPRALDRGESLLIERHGVAVVDVGGPEFARSMTRLARTSDVIYVHIDIDVLDASLVPGHRSAVGGGPSIDALARALSAVAATGKVSALAVVSTSSVGGDGRVVESAALVVRRALRAWRAAGLPPRAGGRP